MKKDKKLTTLLMLLFTLATLLVQGQDFIDGKSAFLHYLKSKEKKVDYATEYIYCYASKEYDKIQANEFLLKESIPSYQRKIEESLADLKNDYCIVLMGEFREYDFKKKGFAFIPATKSYLKTIPTKSECPKCKTFTMLDLKFVNAEKINFIPMDSIKAKALLDKRTHNNSIDRRVGYKIYFKFASSFTVSPLEYAYLVDLSAEIYKVEILNSYGYDYNRGNKSVISTIVVN